MKPGSVAIVGAAETTQLGLVPQLSQIQLHADAALNALADCGLTPKDIDGLACAAESPTELAHYLGVTPTWVIQQLTQRWQRVETNARSPSGRYVGS